MGTKLFMAIAILLAAGKSLRFKDSTAAVNQKSKRSGIKNAHKLFVPIFDKPLVYYSLQALHDHPEIREVYIVVAKNIQKEVATMAKKHHFPKVKSVIAGGKTRQESMIKGFEAALQSEQASLSSKKNSADANVILIHNGANPLVSAEEISTVIAAVKKYGAAAVGKEVVDTIKEVENGHIIKTHDRQKLIAAQTPQGATVGIFKKAITKAKKERKNFSDEAGMIENIGLPVKYIPASSSNFKVTTWHDYLHARTIVGDVEQNFLAGIGQDSHEFKAAKHDVSQGSPPFEKGMFLGGIYLKNEPKFDADSDGDVILHALCNAILQALGEKSLGHFATPMFQEKNIRDSKKYLEQVLLKVKKSGYFLNNIGLMIEARVPKIDPLAADIKKSLAQLTGVRKEKIGITATTGKSLTSFGQGKGLQCFAIVSLKAALKSFIH